MTTVLQAWEFFGLFIIDFLGVMAMVLFAATVAWRLVRFMSQWLP